MSKWGKAVLSASKVRGAASAISKIGTASAGGFLTGTNFAIQDVAREFVSQMKEEDFNAHDIGVKAVSGFMTGGIFGMGHGLFMFSNPVTSILAGGSIMATAEAVADAAEGNDITKESLAQSFLIGAVFSAFSALRRKGRVIEATDTSEREFMNTLKEFNNPATPASNGWDWRCVACGLGLCISNAILAIIG